MDVIAETITVEMPVATFQPVRFTDGVSYLKSEVIVPTSPGVGQ